MSIRCAIYASRPAKNDYEQQCNSSHKQRIACEDHIQSQAGEGWEIIEKHYDDDEYCGGNAERPALQELLRDIEKGLIDCVVACKVNRMSRNLLDFLKMVDVFDEHNVSFVSVTQAFNTSNILGHLILDILKSYVQFEMDVARERSSNFLGYENDYHLERENDD